MQGLIGRKVGMTSIFDEQGKNIACTVIQAGPCVVTQIKTEETDGYNAVQIGFGEKKEKNTTQPLQGHFKNANTTPKSKIVEYRDCELDVKLGDTLTIEDLFEEGEGINIIGTSKGKGFQGVVKRHSFRGVNDATHGQHNRQRAPGSIGAASYPAKVIKGMKMAGRTGGKRVKVRNLYVVKMFPDKNLLLVSGAIPGHKGAYVIIEK